MGNSKLATGHRASWIALLLATTLGAAPFPVSAQPPPPPPVAAASEAEQVKPAEQQSYLWWILRSSGLIGLVILVLSIYFLATVGRLFIELRPQVATPPELVKKTEELLQKGDFTGIFNAVKGDASFYARVLTAGIKELPNGIAAAREAMEGVGEVVTVDMERKISMLAVLGTLGPMIGLLGTLKGMISSFSVIALSDVQLKASEVAGGISEALLLTFEGVALAVPAIYFFAIFKNRVASISVETVFLADEFLRHFYLAYRNRTKGQTSASAPEHS